MIYVVSSQQNFRIAQFFKIIEVMGFPWAKSVVHINYGLVQSRGTRKGTVVSLDQIIREAGHVMHEQMLKNEDKYNAVENPEDTSLEIKIAGVKIQGMATNRINNITFNWGRMKSFEGDTGPHLHYTHVRVASIGRKNLHLLPLPSPSALNFASLDSCPYARELAFLLGTYPDVVKVALKKHEPSGVVTFASKLAHVISSAWDVVIVEGEEDQEKAKAKMFLYQCAREVLGTGMRLLSIRSLERM